MMLRRTARARRSKAVAAASGGIAAWGVGVGLGCGLRRGLGLAGDLLVQVVGEAGADGDEAVQGLAVELGVRGLLAGGVVALGLGWLCRHEQKENIVGGVGSMGCCAALTAPSSPIKGSRSAP